MHAKCAGAVACSGSVVTSGELSPSVAAPAPSKPADKGFDLGEIQGRVEFIEPGDISLAKFLGSGGYGEVGPLSELRALWPHMLSLC